MKKRVLTAVALCLLLWSGVAFAQTGERQGDIGKPRARFAPERSFGDLGMGL